ncbi:MAG: hypothetical protein HKN76_04770 [Saprospiraceae bacterium]|nr:hypothetical protein [Saprospiraceae bacterium]
MIPTLPMYVSIIFVVTTLVTIVLFQIATGNKKLALVLIILAMTAQALLGFAGFFLKTDSTPPRMILLISPALILMLITFFTRRGKSFIQQINLEHYTYLHTIRVFVEIVLLLLFIHATLPESMTFEGRNFDILAGLSAPLVGYFGFRKNKMGRKTILTWNILCLLLVLQVVITGLLSAPSVIQQFSFDQPNFAIFYFPFVWLPGIVVPMVLFGHLVAIYRLRSD